MIETCEECGNSMITVVEMHGKRICERCAEHMGKPKPQRSLARKNGRKMIE